MLWSRHKSHISVIGSAAVHRWRMLLRLLNACLDAHAIYARLPDFLKLVSLLLCSDCAKLLVSRCAEMVHAASASQRLFETPIPVSYTRHTSRSLMLWLLTLPFALWPIMGPSMVPACLFISYVSCVRTSQASCANYSQECLWFSQRLCRHPMTTSYTCSTGCMSNCSHGRYC